MPLAITKSSVKIQRTMNGLRALVPIVATGNSAVGGETLDLSGIPGLPTNAVPDLADIQSTPTSPNTGSGYLYGYIKGTTLNNGKMQTFGATGGGAAVADIGATPYPGDTIVGIFEWFGTYGQ